MNLIRVDYGPFVADLIDPYVFAGGGSVGFLCASDMGFIDGCPTLTKFNAPSARSD